MVSTTRQSFSEVYDIIYHMDEKMYKKIPNNFIELVKQNRDESYKVNIDYNKSINEQELMKETRIILSIIYRDYICDKKEKEALIVKEKEELIQYEKEKYEKYNPKNIFDNRKRITDEQDAQEETQLVIYDNKLTTKIKNFFKRIFRR